jgi:hypothetical protein
MFFGWLPNDLTTQNLSSLSLCSSLCLFLSFLLLYVCQFFLVSVSFFPSSVIMSVIFNLFLSLFPSVYLSFSLYPSVYILLSLFLYFSLLISTSFYIILSSSFFIFLDLSASANIYFVCLSLCLFFFPFSCFSTTPTQFYSI